MSKKDGSLQRFDVRFVVGVAIVYWSESGGHFEDRRC
jgi:hypothetical protein